MAALVPIFAPPESETQLNGNSLFTPFDRTQPARFQQVYERSDFQTVAPEGALINAISLRVDAQLGSSFLTIIPRIQLDLSTTQAGVDSLSAVFDLNVGADNKTVLGPTAVGLRGVGGGGFTGFNVDFFLSEPFFYEPSKGNLLVDFRISEGIGGVGGPHGYAVLDAFDVSGDSVASVYGFGNTMPSSGQVSTLGLATAFRVAVVPEPSTLSLLAGGLVLFGGMIWKRTRNR